MFDRVTSVPPAIAAERRHLRQSDWVARAIWIVAAAAVLAGTGLALLWIFRHPLVTGWDYLSHVNVTLSDAALVRAHDFGALRDQLFLLDRFEPPGLRLLGLPVALLFWSSALTALRLTATASFVLTALLLFCGLRRIAGSAGAAVAVLVFALSPLNLTGAQNFMTEEVLLPCAAVSIWVLAAELLAGERPISVAAVVRLVVLGLMLGWGTLTKLTFLPALGVMWLGVAVWLWWRGRDTGALLLRLLLPGAMLLLLAWPHYVVNGARYLAYAHATAAGFGFGYAEFPEQGIAFAQRVVVALLGDVFGLAGALTLVAGLALLTVTWRMAAVQARVFAVLCGLGGIPTLAAYLLSRNQTDRYMALSVLLLAVPAAIGFGTALRHAVRGGRVAAAIVTAAGCAQIALSGAFAFGTPMTQVLADDSLLSGLRYAISRPNFACDYRTLARLTPQRDGPVRVGVYGETQGVNPYDLELGYLRAGVPSKIVQFSNSSSNGIDWGKMLRDAGQLDYVVLPDTVTGWYQGVASNRTRDAFISRLSDAAEVTQRFDLPTSPEPECRVTVLSVRPSADAAPPRKPPFEPDSYIPGWTTSP